MLRIANVGGSFDSKRSPRIEKIAETGGKESSQIKNRNAAVVSKHASKLIVIGDGVVPPINLKQVSAHNVLSTRAKQLHRPQSQIADTKVNNKRGAKVTQQPGTAGVIVNIEATKTLDQEDD
jgi:hypothetical protein